jgi:hypothetical protein
VLIELFKRGSSDVRSSIVRLFAALAEQSERDPYTILSSLMCGEGQFYESLRPAILVLIKLFKDGDSDVWSSIVRLLATLAKQSEWDPYTMSPSLM